MKINRNILYTQYYRHYTTRKADSWWRRV